MILIENSQNYVSNHKMLLNINLREWQLVCIWKDTGTIVIVTATFLLFIHSILLSFVF